MSAYEVDDAHIDALLTAGIELARGPAYIYGPLRWCAPNPKPDDADEPGVALTDGGIEWMIENRRELTVETANAVGAMLRAENRRSVNYRYDEDELEPVYEFKRLCWGEQNPVERLVVVLKALSCYEYQACEHPEWERSEAHAFCAALQSLCIQRLPGMRDARGWGLGQNDRDVFASASIEDRRKAALRARIAGAS